MPDIAASIGGSVTGAITVISGVRMCSHFRAVVRLQRVDIDLWKPVVAVAVVPVERERLELFKQPAKPLSSRAPVVPEPEPLSADRVDYVKHVISRTQAIHNACIYRRLFR